MNTIAITKEQILVQEGVVILPIKEYQKLREMAVPSYYLQPKEAKQLDKLVQEGLSEYTKGETINANSLKEALKSYGGKKHKN